MSDQLPNLFIIGAPKSGTTTLHHWLSIHPNVFMTKVKEPAYFCRFTEKIWEGPEAEKFVNGLIDSFEDYKGLFIKTENYLWRGESSTDYLWVDEVPSRIAEKVGTENNRFIAVIRNPVERAYSEHSHLVREDKEPLDFISSLKSENRRFNQNWQPLFYHYRRSLYSKQLIRYFDIFGRQNVQVILFDDLKNDSENTYKRICTFLGIDPLPVFTNEVLNRSGKPKLKFLHKFLNDDSLIKKIGKKILGHKRSKHFRSVIDKINLKPMQMTDIEKEYSYHLFKEEIENVENLLSIDLSSWKIPK